MKGLEMVYWHEQFFLRLKDKQRRGGSGLTRITRQEAERLLEEHIRGEMKTRVAGKEKAEETGALYDFLHIGARDADKLPGLSCLSFERRWFENESKHDGESREISGAFE